tara:strand:+ start:537 stop:776 length:240 start_codon:yes stop_codon:yes gene_type:complete
MDKQIISNGIAKIRLTKDQALKLELEINLYINKDFWTDIGDKLYDFHAKDINLPIVVENIKFKSILEVLKKLNIKYEEY